MRPSRVTGTMTVAHWLAGGTVSVLLRDDAEPVNVHDRNEPWAVVQFQRADGVMWRTFCCCGPAAPLPDWRL